MWSVSSNPFLVSVDQLAAVITFITPEFREHRGCVIRGDRFDSANVDSWLASTDGDTCAVEQVVNHLHLYDVIDDDYDDAQLPELETVARHIATAWRDLLRARYGRRQFTVTVESEPDEYGPTISFHQADNCSECRRGGQVDPT